MTLIVPIAPDESTTGVPGRQRLALAATASEGVAPAGFNPWSITLQGVEQARSINGTIPIHVVIPTASRDQRWGTITGGGAVAFGQNVGSDCRMATIQGLKVLTANRQALLINETTQQASGFGAMRSHDAARDKMRGNPNYDPGTGVHTDTRGPWKPIVKFGSEEWFPAKTEFVEQTPGRTVIRGWGRAPNHGAFNECFWYLSPRPDGSVSPFIYFELRCTLSDRLSDSFYRDGQAVTSGSLSWTNLPPWPELTLSLPGTWKVHMPMGIEYGGVLQAGNRTEYRLHEAGPIGDGQALCFRGYMFDEASATSAERADWALFTLRDEGELVAIAHPDHWRGKATPWSGMPRLHPSVGNGHAIAQERWDLTLSNLRARPANYRNTWWQPPVGSQANPQQGTSTEDQAHSRIGAALAPEGGNPLYIAECWFWMRFELARARWHHHMGPNGPTSQTWDDRDGAMIEFEDVVDGVPLSDAAWFNQAPQYRGWRNDPRKQTLYLGKDDEKIYATKYRRDVHFGLEVTGYNDEHYSINNLCAMRLFTGSWMLLECLKAHMIDYRFRRRVRASMGSAARSGPIRSARIEQGIVLAMYGIPDSHAHYRERVLDRMEERWAFSPAAGNIAPYNESYAPVLTMVANNVPWVGFGRISNPHQLGTGYSDPGQAYNTPATAPPSHPTWECSIAVGYVAVARAFRKWRPQSPARPIVDAFNYKIFATWADWAFIFRSHPAASTAPKRYFFLRGNRWPRVLPPGLGDDDPEIPWGTPPRLEWFDDDDAGENYIIIPGATTNSSVGEFSEWYEGLTRLVLELMEEASDETRANHLAKVIAQYHAEWIDADHTQRWSKFALGALHDRDIGSRFITDFDPSGTASAGPAIRYRRTDPAKVSSPGVKALTALRVRHSGFATPVAGGVQVDAGPQYRIRGNITRADPVATVEPVEGESGRVLESITAQPVSVVVAAFEWRERSIIEAVVDAGGAVKAPAAIRQRQNVPSKVGSTVIAPPVGRERESLDASSVGVVISGPETRDRQSLSAEARAVIVSGPATRDRVAIDAQTGTSRTVDALVPLRIRYAVIASATAQGEVVGRTATRTRNAPVADVTHGSFAVDAPAATRTRSAFDASNGSGVRAGPAERTRGGPDVRVVAAVYLAVASLEREVPIADPISVIDVDRPARDRLTPEAEARSPVRAPAATRTRQALAAGATTRGVVMAMAATRDRVSILAAVAALAKVSNRSRIALVAEPIATVVVAGVPTRTRTSIRATASPGLLDTTPSVSFVGSWDANPREQQFVLFSGDDLEVHVSAGDLPDQLGNADMIRFRLKFPGAEIVRQVGESANPDAIGAPQSSDGFGITSETVRVLLRRTDTASFVGQRRGRWEIRLRFGQEERVVARGACVVHESIVK